ncbi:MULTISPECIES: membrane protein [Streptacidiphilus]|uniref:Integral membrane protein n=1 Tax=Streptacidiphilus cavernicola TaxID=3342716 RepID=A0ABV6UTV6_9ACTN|nr:membrane protein [Streptacidiphilus jeojiense]
MAGVEAARDRAQAVLRVRGAALAVAALPAAAAAVLIAGGVTGHLGAAGSADAAGWDAARWAVSAVAAVVLLGVLALAAVLRRVRPPLVPAVPLTETEAPELYRLVRDVAERMDVPAPARIALTPDCDSWLEDPSPAAAPALPVPAAAGGDALGREAAAPPAPTLVIGSPFMWWMRVAELRALLAPVVAGTACSADPDIAAARRFVRALDAALGLAADRAAAPAWQRPALVLLGRVSALLLRRCRGHAAEMERAVAGWASEQARQVDYGLRIAAQEQVGLAYAGWDRLLTRVALPAWQIGRWPGRLDAGVVSALTELSRRDRLADGFETRLGERPACDLLEEPGRIDEAVSLLAARLFHGGPQAAAPAAAAARWAPVDWQDYPQDVVERVWRSHADDLLAVAGLDRTGTDRTGTAPSARAISELLVRLREDGAADALAGALTSRRLRAAAAAPAQQPAQQLQPPRTGRDLLGEHLSALVCCVAVGSGAAAAGLDWLDGPVLLVDGVRRTDLAAPVALAVEHGDGEPLWAWLTGIGVRVEKPVRLP